MKGERCELIEFGITNWSKYLHLLLLENSENFCSRSSRVHVYLTDMI